MQWVTQGLTKVLPQPDDKYKETEDKQEEHTEVSWKLKLEAKARRTNGRKTERGKFNTQKLDGLIWRT